MGSSNDCWGIEVGANAIKAMRLVREGDQIVLGAYDILPFKKVLTTPDLDVDEAIRVNLDKLLSRHTLSRSSIVISVPGHMAFIRFTKLPPVDPKKIPDIVRFEAQQQIPFRMDQVEWDYQTFSQPDSPDVEVGLFAIVKDRINTFLSNYRAVGMRIDGVTFSPLALFNAMAFDLDISPESPGTIMLDIGTSSTDVIIYDRGSLWARTLPIGGNDFTEALVRAFKLSFKKAEKLKREAGTSKYARQIFQAMRPVFADLVQELQKTLGFYRSLNRDAQLKRLYGFGSTFRLPGLQKFLQQQLQMDVIRPDGFHKLQVEGKKSADFADNALSMGTAYGLALQGLGLERVDANLLPQKMVQQRLWRAKQPWFLGAASVVLAATVGAGVRYSMDKQAAFSAANEQKKRQTESIVNRAERLVSGWNDVEGGSDPRQRIENLRRILDYRDIWPKVMHDLSLAAQSMTPQRELLSTNYAAMQSMPRDRWRRVFVDSVTAEYDLKLDESASTGRSARTYSIDDIWGQRTEDAAPKPEQTEEQKTRPPSFVIKVKGTTPKDDGPRFLSETFIRWLNQNATRLDRPYQIRAEKPLISIRQLRTLPGGGGQTSERRPTPTRGLRMRTRTTSQSEEAAVDTNSLYPTRPLVSKPKPSDWVFEIHWTVTLVRPEDARQTEESGRDATLAPAAEASQSDAGGQAQGVAVEDQS